MSNPHPHPQLSTARPHPASLPLFESHSLSRSISPFCCHPVGICGCLFLPLTFCCHPAAKWRELLLSATTAQDFYSFDFLLSHCVEYARPCTPPRARHIAPSIAFTASPRNCNLPPTRAAIASLTIATFSTTDPVNATSNSLSPHLLHHHQHLLPQLLPSPHQQPPSHLIPRPRQPHHRRHQPRKIRPRPCVRKPHHSPQIP